MSRITPTKLARMNTEEIIDRDKHGRARINLDGSAKKRTRVLGYEPPIARQRVMIEFRGYKMYVMAAPGQSINKLREYIRQAKKYGLNPLKLSLKYRR